MIPLPETPLSLKKGTRLKSKADVVYILESDAEWDGKEISGCTARKESNGTTYSGDDASGRWPFEYEIPDYPWRELDRNCDAVLWESVQEGEYYQCISMLSVSSDEIGLLGCALKGWRAELGQCGWLVTVEGGKQFGKKGYIPRAPTPQPAPAPPVIPDPPPPPKRQWPTRSAHVAQLAMEMSVPLADRMKRLL